VRTTVVVVVLIVGLGWPVAASTRANVPKLADCGRAAVEPPTIVLACADAGFTITKLQWSSWRTAGAVGHGVAWRNKCVPDCAAGHFVRWSVVVRLSRAHFCRRWNRVLFTRLAWRAVGSVPKPFEKTRAETRRLPLLHFCP
jgi:hypothetical protein